MNILTRKDSIDFIVCVYYIYNIMRMTILISLYVYTVCICIYVYRERESTFSLA